MTNASNQQAPGLDVLRQIDVSLIVDTTGSMGPFLNIAKNELLLMIGALAEEAAMDLQVGLVEFRDHPPQDESFVARSYPLTSDLPKLKRSLRKLNADGGGDSPEAVYQGIVDACLGLAWRPHSARFGFLVGDAPPHAFAGWAQTRRGLKVDKGGDTWPKACPSGFDVDDVCAAAERVRLRLYTLVLGAWQPTLASFQSIAEGTGGTSFAIGEAKQSLAQIKAIFAQEFASIDFDRQVWDKVHQLGEIDAALVAEALDCPRVQVAAAIARMGARGLWEAWA